MSTSAAVSGRSGCVPRHGDRDVGLCSRRCLEGGWPKAIRLRSVPGQCCGSKRHVARCSTRALRFLAAAGSPPVNSQPRIPTWRRVAHRRTRSSVGGQFLRLRVDERPDLVDLDPACTRRRESRRRDQRQRIPEHSAPHLRDRVGRPRRVPERDSRARLSSTPRALLARLNMENQ